MVQILDATRLTGTVESSSKQETKKRGRWSFGGFSDSLYSLLLRIGQVSNSLLGQVVIISLGEMTGARLGGLAMSDICHHFFVPLTLITSGATIYYQATHQTDRLTKVALLTSAVAMTALVTTPSEKLLGEQNWLAIGWGTVGGWVGTIAGGYAGQLFAGGVPQAEYSLSMAKCIGVTEFTHAILAPPPASLMGYPLGFVRGSLITSLGLCAYYSPQLIDILQSIARNEKDKTLLTRIFTQIIEERCSGRHSADIARKISDQIMAPLKEISRYLVDELEGESCRNLLSALIGNGMECLLNPKTTPTFALRSFEEYVKILKASDIQKAHAEFECAFLDDLQGKVQKKRQLIDAIQKKIKILYDSQTSTEQMIDFVLNSLLNDKQAQGLAALVIQKIQEAEIDLIGLSLLSQNQAGWIEELFSIHIQNYVIFALSNYHKFEKALTPLEEKQILLDCNHAIFTLYFNHIVPFFIARSAQVLTGSTIHTLFQVKESVRTIFKKKSQKSYMKEHPIVLNSYFGLSDNQREYYEKMIETGSGCLEGVEEEELELTKTFALSPSMILSGYFDELDESDRGNVNEKEELEIRTPSESDNNGKLTIKDVLKSNYF